MSVKDTIDQLCHCLVLLISPFVPLYVTLFVPELQGIMILVRINVRLPCPILPFI